MKPKRTEEDIILQSEIKVILGGNEYGIKPLVIRDSRGWRKKVIDLIVPFPGLIKVTMDTPEDFGKALTQMLVTNSDQVIDLFFEYAKDLNREAIEGIATEAEIAKAFEEMVKVSFPLAESLPTVMKKLFQ